jgi:hypothetical protein
MMWMLTTRGFYSAVQKPGDGPNMLTVRARRRDDLDRLRDLLPDAKPYQEKRVSDYAWRIRVSVADWSMVCAVLATEIDYSNFKDEAKKQRGARYANALSRCWTALLSLESVADRRRFYGAGPDPYGALDGDPNATDELGGGKRPVTSDTLALRQELDEASRQRRNRPAGTPTTPRRRATHAKKGKRGKR